MKPDLLTCLESSLRASIAAELFAEAETQLGWYALAAGYQLHRLPPGSPAAIEFGARVNSFFEWAGLRTNAFRACAAPEVARLRRMTSFDREPATPHLAVSA